MRPGQKLLIFESGSREVADTSVGCGVDRAKKSRVELTAGSGGEPVGNYTLSISVNQLLFVIPADLSEEALAKSEAGIHAPSLLLVGGTLSQGSSAPGTSCFIHIDILYFVYGIEGRFAHAQDQYRT